MPSPNVGPASPLVLVIEDDDEIRDLIRDLLLDEGYRVATAIHGAEALERIQQEPPQVILLDMKMPVMDGRAFAKAYKQSPGPHAPIVVMAATDHTGPAAHMSAAGYTSKPFDVDTFLGDVREHIVRRPPAQDGELLPGSSVVNVAESGLEGIPP
jgi:CheY-like chemotaxis protein